jgi:hypothetical protein
LRRKLKMISYGSTNFDDFKGSNLRRTVEYLEWEILEDIRSLQLETAMVFFVCQRSFSVEIGLLSDYSE